MLDKRALVRLHARLRISLSLSPSLARSLIPGTKHCAQTFCAEHSRKAASPYVIKRTITFSCKH